MDSNLDDTYEYLCAFGRALGEFNDELRASAADLRKSDEQISALWRDKGSEPYRRRYEPLAESLDQYLRADAPRFEDFVQIKIRQLGTFLHGE